jgi:uncharacterized protein YecE (DUF72 family)
MNAESQLEFLGRDRPAWLENLRAQVKTWAERGVFFGGSSWKYEGWFGQIYSRDRYAVRGKFSKTHFERRCIEEYAEWFPTVCGDFSFYDFYSEKFWAGLFAQVPATFQFGFKAPEQITAPSFPQHARYGAMAGRRNEDFLGVELLKEKFFARLAPYRRQIGYVVFEFPQFHRDVPEFLPRLDQFLGGLPTTLRYGVEIRTKKLLRDQYFSVLHRHNVAHVFNSWTRMPSIGNQMMLDGAFTTDFTVARLLLRPGRKYQRAVESFEPYNEVRDPYPEGYQQAADLVRKGNRKIFLAVNNRFVGNTPLAIHEILKELEGL